MAERRRVEFGGKREAMLKVSLSCGGAKLWA